MDGRWRDVEPKTIDAKGYYLLERARSLAYPLFSIESESDLEIYIIARYSMMFREVGDLTEQLFQRRGHHFHCRIQCGGGHARGYGGQRFEAISLLLRVGRLHGHIDRRSSMSYHC